MTTAEEHALAVGEEKGRAEERQYIVDWLRWQDREDLAEQVSKGFHRDPDVRRRVELNVQIRETEEKLKQLKAAARAEHEKAETRAAPSEDQ